MTEIPDYLKQLGAGGAIILLFLHAMFSYLLKRQKQISDSSDCDIGKKLDRYFDIVDAKLTANKEMLVKIVARLNGKND